MKSSLHHHCDHLFGWDANNVEVKTTLLEHRYSATRLPVIFTNILVAGVVTAALWSLKPHPLLMGWFGGIIIVALLLAWSMSYYARHRSEHTPQHWALRFTLGALINGLAWGLGALLFFDPATPTGNILMVGVICGMTAGNVVTSFAIPGTAYAFLIPAILLSMFMPLTRGDFADHTLVLLWIPYLLIMMVLTRMAHKGLAQSIQLSYENAQLAQHLEAARKQAEQLARTKSDFLAVMSHEIRTPMHGMLGIAEVLSATSLDPKQKLFLEHLQRAGEYLAQLLNNILDFSKIEAEKLVLNEAVFSLPELVSEVTGLFTLEASKKGVDLQAIIPAHLPPYWKGDVHRLKQVLINLVGNALKYTEHGYIRLEVSYDATHHDSPLHFRITDTGTGIAPDLLTHIFEPFVQERSSASRVYGGTGLGLAISKRLVNAMGGNISVESREGRGSIFSFDIVLAPAEHHGQQEAFHVAVDDDSAIPFARILLADDSPFNRLVVKEFLGNTHCAINEAENGQEAVAMCQQTRYDIILMDMRMPVMNGIDAVRHIREMESAQQRRPSFIIMLTASVFDSDRLAIMEAGCNELLTKPVQKATLLNLLRNNADDCIESPA